MNNDFFNFLDNSLNKLDKTIHPKLEDTFVDNFLHELQNYLDKHRSYNLFKELANSTNLHLTDISNNFFEFMNYREKELYYVPKNAISFIGKEPEIGEALSLIDKDTLTVNYGGIPLWNYQIPEYKNECTIAK